MSHATAPIPQLEAYFGAPDVRPVIVEAYLAGTGWYRYPMRKRISVSWARKMRADGVERVTLEANGRRADFSLDELIRGAAR